MHKGRMEAFTDGVMAVALTIMVLELTIMVLELHPPDVPGWHALRGCGRWP